MDAQTYLKHLRADGARLVEAATDLDAPVPACPGWTVRDVVLHTGEVYQHKLACMRLGRAPGQDYEQAPPEGQDPVEWLRASLATLVDELVTRGPEAPSYTWWEPDRTVGFWYRRMAQETAVHRVDVESGTGDVGPVDDDLAVDGVDELLTIFLRNEDWPSEPVTGTGTVSVRTGDRAWKVAVSRDAVDVEETAGSADAVVTGEPSEMLLWLWGRRPDEAVRVEGDPAAVAILRQRLHIAGQ